MDDPISPHLSAFGPINPTLKKFQIIGWDSEDDTHGIPISFAFHTGTSHFYTRSADEAITYIYNTPGPAIFVAHNLEYDLGNLMKHCDFVYVEEMVYASRLLKCTLFGTHNFMLNSASFFQGALSSLGKLVGLPKLEGDPFNKSYVLRDAHIPQVFMTQIQERLHALGVNLGLSIGQMAMAVFRKNFVPGKTVTFNPSHIVQGPTSAYYGGRVELFYKGIVEGPVYVADINSSYPDVMRNKPYPDTGRMEVSRLATHLFGVGRFKIRVPETLFIPILPVRSEAGRLFFPVGDVEGNWTYAEVRKALEMGCSILSEEDGFGTNFSVSPYFDFVDHFWEERKMVKKKLEENPGDPKAQFESLFLKLVLNNLYGKAAQHKPSVKMTRIKMPAYKLARLKPYQEVRQGPFYGYTFPREKAPKTANYLWGVYVTAYARLSLYEKMIAVHASGARLLYCDTDSVMFTGEEGKKALPLGSELGQMGIETFDLGVFRQAKGYLLCNREKETNRFQSKGFLFQGGKRIGNIQRCLSRFEKEKKREVRYEILKVACKGVPTQYALPFLRDGLVSVQKPMRLKEGLIRVHAAVNKDKDAAFLQDIGVNIWRMVPKTMKGIYIKRKGENGITYPVNVSEIPFLEENAFGEPSPFEPLSHYRIKNTKAKKNPWEKRVLIPAGWHRKTGLKRLEAFFAAQRLHFLKFEELFEIKPGDLWFRGMCENHENSKYGGYYKIRLRQFLKKDVSDKNILVAFPEKYLEGIPIKKIIGFPLSIWMNTQYNSEADLDLKVRYGV